jgi:hypothetical protein
MKTIKVKLKSDGTFTNACLAKRKRKKRICFKKV